MFFTFIVLAIHFQMDFRTYLFLDLVFANNRAALSDLKLLLTQEYVFTYLVSCEIIIDCLERMTNEWMSCIYKLLFVTKTAWIYNTKKIKWNILGYNELKKKEKTKLFNIDVKETQEV